MKFTAITLITALIVSTFVLVGIPMFKTWAATTGDCLYINGDPGDDHLYLNDLHPWHPCGHKFTIRHFGYGDHDTPCNCRHGSIECIEIIFLDYETETEVYSAPLGPDYEIESCGTETFDHIEYCVYLHVPRADAYLGARKWKYYYECDGGSRLPITSGTYYDFVADHEDCDAPWDYLPCDMCD